ncbi:MAG: hypothetical protein Q9187_004678 [Circinaria calcarea]
MRDIYLKAQRVLVWLGPAANDSDMAMDLFVLLAQRAENQGTVAWLESHALDPMNFKAWKALQDLLSRNWWRRSWAIQEFALGHEVHLVCGERRLTCSQLERANRVLFDGWPKIFDKGTMLKINLNARAQDMMRNLLALRRYLQSGKTVSLLMCLSATRDSLASDPRDQLFAKLGMVGPETAVICRPDYHRGTEAVVEFLHNRSILKCHGISFDEIDGVMFDPWIELSKAPDDFELLFARAFRECDDLLQDIQTRPGDIAPATRPGPSNFEKCWQGMRDLRLGAIPLRDLVKSSLTRLEACTPSSSIPAQELSRFGVVYHALWPAFQHSMGQVMYDRRVFTTRNGYLGVGSQTLTRNDKIYVFFGCNVPLILWPHKQQYELIGECYVHGIMNGEVINALDSGRAQSLSVELC